MATPDWSSSDRVVPRRSVRPSRRVAAFLFCALVVLAAAVALGTQPAAAAAPGVTLTAAGPHPLFVKDSVTLRVAVEPAAPGAAVTVELETPEGWRAIGAATLDAASRARIRWPVDTAMQLGLRATIAADATRPATTSATLGLFANPWNAHRVPYKFRRYVVIVRHEYRLYYYERGELVRRFDVALGRPGYPTPLGTFHIYGKRRPGGGALGACVMYYHPAGAIAIHGTDQPWLLRRHVPRNFSHGCCRMYNKDALWLYQRVHVGTTVHNLR